MKLRCSPVRVLEMLQGEFASWAVREDAYFSRLTVQRKPLLKKDGQIDGETLKLLADAFVRDGDKSTVIESDWAEWPEDPTCYREFLWARGQTNSGFVDQFMELSQTAMRSIAAIPSLAAKVHFGPEDLQDNLAWDSYWQDMLIRLGKSGAHPVVRTLSSRLQYDRPLGEIEFFALGAHTLLFRQVPSDTLTRLKRAARSRSIYEELSCGIVRGSAYAIAWLLEDCRSDARARGG